MRFEVSYPTGAVHEVELPGSVVVLGRDPTCDLVLNDTKCSRRHAVVEDGPGGPEIRDAGSANGVEVNGRRVSRARLRPGDTVRLGDVRLKVLGDLEATVVIGPEALDLAFDADVPRSVGEPPNAASVEVTVPTSERATALSPAAARPSRALRRSRPLTVTVLVALWLATAIAAPAAGILVAVRAGLGTIASAAVVAGALLLGAAGGVMALGLRALAPWARHLQIAIATVGILACPFSLASATVLLYLLRPEVRRGFEERGVDRERAGAGSSEPTFALSLVGMLALGFLVTALVAIYLRAGR
jgi:hypothetical protein